MMSMNLSGHQRTPADTWSQHRTTGRTPADTVVYILFLMTFLMTVNPAQGFNIGTLSTTYVDAARSRSIATQVFYPATSPGTGAPVAEGVFPVIVFGHGYQIGYAGYDFLWTALVPEGYILVLPTTEGGVLPSHLEFGRDLAFLCDHFQTLGSDSASMFYGHIHNSSAIMGHSMGGGAALLAAEYSSEVRALASFAAAETNPSAIAAAAQIQLPVLMFSGEEDCVTPPVTHQIPMFDALISDCRTHITVTGASHCQFAGNNTLCRVGEVFAGCSATIGLDTQEIITLYYLKPWLDVMLKGIGSSWNVFYGRLIDGTENGSIQYSVDCIPVTPTPAPSATPMPSMTPDTCKHTGDVNQDSFLTAGDAQTAFQIALEMISPSYLEGCAADCDGSGIVTSGDAQVIFQYALGLAGSCSDLSTD
jgi:pimeloyl-ACP methyl ester carboxylesterase